MKQCQICKKEIKGESYEIYLDGTDDFYVLEVCGECDDKYCDCFTPEEVDKIVKKL